MSDFQCVKELREKFHDEIISCQSPGDILVASGLGIPKYRGNFAARRRFRSQLQEDEENLEHAIDIILSSQTRAPKSLPEETDIAISSSGALYGAALRVIESRENLMSNPEVSKRVGVFRENLHRHNEEFDGKYTIFGPNEGLFLKVIREKGRGSVAQNIGLFLGIAIALEEGYNIGIEYEEHVRPRGGENFQEACIRKARLNDIIGGRLVVMDSAVLDTYVSSVGMLDALSDNVFKVKERKGGALNEKFENGELYYRANHYEVTIPELPTLGADLQIVDGLDWLKNEGYPKGFHPAFKEERTRLYDKLPSEVKRICDKIRINVNMFQRIPIDHSESYMRPA